MAKTNMTVVRNQGYSRVGFNVRERHNERKNEVYGNGDIDQSREHLNIHYLQRLGADGSPRTYQQIYEKMLAEGTIVEKGLKKDAKVFAELVFDVNTDYFERNGGYDFAVRFYAEAFKLAVKEVGDERYIISAVLHADEKNSALSKELGRDVYHYHLHVVYVPVVEKEVLWSKRCKDPALVGTVKEVIPQVSHSKKWPIRVPVERDGKTIVLNSYSLLQDRYFEHMRAAGFEGFERGERGSTKEHLTVLEYKVQQEQKRLDDINAKAEQAEAALANTEKTLKTKSAQAEKLTKETAVKSKAKATIKEIDAMGKPALLGNGFTVSTDEMKTLKSLAKKGVTLEDKIAAQKKKMDTLDSQIADLNIKLRDAQAEVNHWYHKYTDLWNEVKPFVEAIRKFPQKMLGFAISLLPQVHRREKEQAQQQEQQQEQQRQAQRRTTKKSYGMEI